MTHPAEGLWEDQPLLVADKTWRANKGHIQTLKGTDPAQSAGGTVFLSEMHVESSSWAFNWVGIAPLWAVVPWWTGDSRDVRARTIKS